MTLSGGDAAIHANFGLNTYTLNITDDGYGSTDPAGDVTVSHGVDLNISATPDEGYSFARWISNDQRVVFGDPAQSSTTVRLTGGAATIRAIFELTLYELTIIDDGHGIIVDSPIRIPVRHGISSYFYAPVPPGYNFTGWTTDDPGVAIEDLTKSNTSFTLTAGDATVQANYSNKPHVLTINTDGNGTTNPLIYVMVNPDEPQDIEATADVGYEFSEWTVESGSVSIDDRYDPTTTATLTEGDATIRANFNSVCIFEWVETRQGYNSVPQVYYADDITHTEYVTVGDTVQITTISFYQEGPVGTSYWFDFIRWEVEQGAVTFVSGSATTPAATVSIDTCGTRIIPVYGPPDTTISWDEIRQKYTPGPNVYSKEIIPHHVSLATGNTETLTTLSAYQEGPNGNTYWFDFVRWNVTAGDVDFVSGSARSSAPTIRVNQGPAALVPVYEARVTATSLRWDEVRQGYVSIANIYNKEIVPHSVSILPGNTASLTTIAAYQEGPSGNTYRFDFVRWNVTAGSVTFVSGSATSRTPTIRVNQGPATVVPVYKSQ